MCACVCIHIYLNIYTQRHTYILMYTHNGYYLAMGNKKILVFVITLMDLDGIMINEKQRKQYYAPLMCRI